MNVVDFFAAGNAVYENLLEEVCNEYDVTYMELTILLFLANNPKMDKARDIVEKRHIAKSHASTSIRSLIEKGYIEGQNLNGDKRSIHLSVKPSAKKIVHAGQKAQKEYFKVITKGFSEEELNMLKTCMQKMKENLDGKEKEIRNGK